MNKTKSAICLVLITILIAVLCVASTVSFSYGTDGMHTYNSFIRVMDKDAGMGGGYTAVYYPEGVISAEEYETNVKKEPDEEKRAEYEDKYTSYANGAIYLEKEKVFGKDTQEASEEFKTSFANGVSAITRRFERKCIPGARVEVSDGFTVRVTLPALAENPGTALSFFGYSGEFSVAYGSDLDSASTIMPKKPSESIKEYVKGAYSRVSQDTAFVIIDFTDKGREAIKSATASATSSSSSTMFFKVGDDQVIGLTVSEAIDQSTLGISGSYTADSADTVAVLIDEALNGVQTDLAMSVGEVKIYESGFGGMSLTFLYIAIGVAMLAMAAFFLIRYGLLGFSHIYSYLSFALCMILCVAFVPFLYLSAGTVAAFALTSVLLCMSNIVCYEYARKEYALGKTMTSSVKTGYKKCFWHIFDLHIAVALLAFLIYAIALTELQTFAFVLGIGAVFSGVCSLAVNRFCWAITMIFNKNKGAFCRFKREEVETDD